MRTIGTALGLAVILLAGCSTVQPLAEVSATRTTLPMPSGATTVPWASGAAVESCDATASLRPSTAGGPAVEAIQRRGRLIVGVDQSTNLFSFRDPVSGELQGFDIDIAREVARDLLGDPDKVEFRLLTSPERISALQDGTVDIVAKALTITCARAEQIAFSTVYFEASQRLLVPKDSPVQGPADLAGKRVCSEVDTTSLATVSRVAPTATLARRSELGRLPGRASAGSGGRGQHRRYDPGRHGRTGSQPAHRRAELGGRTVRYRDQQVSGRFGTRGQCQPGTDPTRRDVVVAVPEVAHRARPGAESARTEVSGLTWLETRERAPSW